MGQERRAAHEEDRECRQADVRHRVVVATRRPLALVRQTGADPLQFRYQFITRLTRPWNQGSSPGTRENYCIVWDEEKKSTTCGILDSVQRGAGQHRCLTPHR